MKEEMYVVDEIDAAEVEVEVVIKLVVAMINEKRRNATRKNVVVARRIVIIIRTQIDEIVIVTKTETETEIERATETEIGKRNGNDNNARWRDNSKSKSKKSSNGKKRSNVKKVRLPPTSSIYYVISKTFHLI